MKHRLTLIALIIPWLSSTAFGQQAKLEGHVFDDKDKQVSGVRVVVPGGQAAVTDSKGHFRISFPVSTQPGQATRIEVVKSNWAVFQPMFGNCVTQSMERNFEPLKVIIIPKGSPLALSPKGLSHAIAKWADERVKLRSQVTGLKSQIDEYAFLREYAERYGFTLDQFENAAKEWAKNAVSNDKEEQAVKEYFLKNYTRAAQLAGESALVADEELEQANKQKTEASLKVIRRFKLEGNAFYEQKKFREALGAYNEIDKRFSTGKLSKEDLIEEWAEIKNLLGNAKEELGTRVEGQESESLLSESVKEYGLALTVFTREALPQDWAMTQNNLGAVLSVQGEQLEGAEGVRLLGQAVDAYRAALQVYTREAQPRQWAATQNNLGIVLNAQGERLEGAEGLRLLGQAVDAYRAALQVYRREALPQEWATTQNNLGGVLSAQGERLKGAEGVRLLGEAVDAYRATLQVYTREALPQKWAMTQNNLGNVLSAQGERLKGAEGVRLLGQAVDAFRAALQVRTREALPQQWATTQNNLGNALQKQGQRLEGAEGVRLLGEAVDAYRAALQVRTREALPQQWATTQNNLAMTYVRLRNWLGAAESFLNVLTLNPDDKQAYANASALYHDRLFRFEEAFALNQKWLARHPEDVSAQADFAEKQFTTGRFPECEQRINALLAKPEVPAKTKTALRAIEIANLLALNQAGQVPGKIDALIDEVSRQPATFEVDWVFDGTRHFINQNEKLLPYRAWLGQLFDALHSKDRDAMLKAFQEVLANFKGKR
jgi:tetratricopeptide (TPR) repeat protein